MDKHFTGEIKCKKYMVSITARRSSVFGCAGEWFYEGIVYKEDKIVDNIDLGNIDAPDNAFSCAVSYLEHLVSKEKDNE